MKAFVTIILFALLSVSCNNNTENTPAPVDVSTEISEINFIHTVFFWLKDGVSDEQRNSFESGLYDLGNVACIGEFFIGTPADTHREVIDNSYDYSWIVHFANATDQASYQTDSIHLEFIAKYSALWEKVVVYDSELIGHSK
ncbi:MAG: Dabb family protein [Bacteroidales bacterium]|nr:Dabb family protein [Bacteroidales bacterium]MCF8390199.1 Dabb family protein [Bacteroidales bacterium]